MDKSLMFGDAKYIITGWKELRDRLFIFKHRQEAEEILKRIKEQYPEETELYIEEI